MRTWTLTTALMLMARAIAAADCPSPQSTQLVGLWESAAKSKGGIGHAMELRADGTFVEVTTVIVDTYYRVSGDQVLLSEKPGGATLTSMPLDLGDETPEVEKKWGPRVGSRERVSLREPGQEPIVGVWRYQHPTGVLAFERYTADGQMSLRLPLKSSQGCYSLDDAKLTLKLNGREMKASIESRDEHLKLTFPGKEPAEYRRDPAGPWYELERTEKQP